MLRRLVRSIFTCRRWNAVKPINSESKKTIENLDGRRLTFDVNEEVEIYFQQLNDAWN
jgi:hypothetical protein